MDGKRQIAVGRWRVGLEPALALAAVLLFIAFTAWWLAVDKRLPGGGDPGRQVSVMLGVAEALKSGDPLRVFDFGPIGDAYFYPPLVHLVGAIPTALGGAAEDAGTLALNLVFVPMLAAGCYGVGRRLYGPRAGALAVVFALGTPMVLSLFHVFLLDAPLAAVVALTVWALLATERLSRPRASALAGGAIGLALLVKTTAPLYFAGVLTVILVRGGWRQWRNLLLLTLVALLVAGPYYVQHLGNVFDLSGETTVLEGDPIYGASTYGVYERFSLENLLWYGWAAINIQYYVPLLALFAVGLVSALRAARRLPELPELLAGLAVGYLATTFLLAFRDPRYTLPLIVYVAVLATGWMTAVAPRWRRVGIAALLAIVALNVWSAAHHGGPRLKLSLAGEEALYPHDPGAFTFADDRGWMVGPPIGDDLWHRLLEAAERESVTTAEIRIREGPLFGTDTIAFADVAGRYGVSETSFARPPVRPELRVNTWFTSDSFWVERKGLPEPCDTLRDGTTTISGSNPAEISVAVERLGADGRYRRWCEF